MNRERWASRTIFIFAAIGSAVGLGNIWRYPYLTYKFGGGAFLFPYIISILVIGIPLLLLEFYIGQKFQRGAVGSFGKINPKLKGIGLAAVLVGFVIVTYYAAVMAWSLVYLFNSFSSPLPWAGDSEGYFFNNVLGISEGVHQIGGVNLGLLLALFLVWVMIYFIVRKGVKSVGKVVAITVPLPIILLIALGIRGVTLPGAMSGIMAYISPDFSALLSAEVWISAASQVFFSFSIGFGIMIAYASFNKKDQDAVGDTYITALADAIISFFAGFVVFSILGYMAFVSGTVVDEVATSGAGLAFVVFPEALALMPLGSLFAVLFFLTLITLGIDSAFSIVEAVNTTIGDRYKKPNRPKIALIVCTVAFLLGFIFITDAGLFFLDIIDHFITNIGLVTVGLFEAIAIGWIYGAEKLRKEINSVSKLKIGKWWTVMVKYVAPVALVGLLMWQLIQDIMVPYEGYSRIALLSGWIAVLVPLIIAFVYTLRQK